ncbi:MAG: serine--tRNA ligase [Candidatus Pacearchaeota archaeon]
MLDIKIIRNDPLYVKKSLKNRGYDEKIIDDFLKKDEEWRRLKKEDDSLRHERNEVSEKINSFLKEKNKESAEELKRRAKEIAEKIKKNEERERELKKEIDEILSRIPNLPYEDVPIGDKEFNKEIKRYGEIKEIKEAKSHLEIGENLGIIDIKRATKVTGSGFYFLFGKGAKLQRALVQFMMDFHEKNGFIEVNPPQLVNRKTAFGTGNLPKFEEDLYKTNEELILIPTAEVVLTNIYADEILNEKDLPKKFFAFTECYRTEAGRRAGEEGLYRLHQFEKVEMVYICNPEDSWKFLEEMTLNAERILEELEIPYRRVLLSTGDMGFASAKTYDIEVWSPYLKKYLECSSCSNCTDFQARRMNTRVQGKKGLRFVHTLNGSGLALPRLMISLIENNQSEDGSIKIPKALWKYTGFKEIKKEE